MTDFLTKNRAILLATAVFTITTLALVFILRMIVSEAEFGAGVSYTRETISRAGHAPAGEITRDFTAGQTFRSRAANLDRVQVEAVTFDRLNTAPLVVSLHGYPDGDLVRKMDVPPPQIIGNSPLIVQFEPIGDSAEKTYLLTIESPEGRPGNAFSVWVGDCDCYRDGSFYANGVERPGRELMLEVGYQTLGTSVWRELLNRMSQYKPPFFKGAALVVIGGAGFGFFVLAFALFAGSLFAQPAREESDSSDGCRDKTFRA